MQLYYSPGSCSLAPHIVAREANLPVSLHRVDLKTKRTADGTDYLLICPDGYVPALVMEDGVTLTEAAVIVQYLADRAPAQGLAPAPGTFDRYRLEEWLNFVATELHKTWGPLFYRSTGEDRKAAVRTQLVKRIQRPEAMLASHPYLMGERFCAADAYLFAVLRWAALTGVDLPPAVGEYQLRIAARPAVREALRAEGLLSQVQL